MKIRWTKPAIQALESIQDYIVQDNRHAAYEVAQKIHEMVKRLREYPQLGRPGRVRGTLELVIPGLPYIVPYRVKKGEVHILTVFHTSRKWPQDFE